MMARMTSGMTQLINRGRASTNGMALILLRLSTISMVGTDRRAVHHLRRVRRPRPTKTTGESVERSPASETRSFGAHHLEIVAIFTFRQPVDRGRKLLFADEAHAESDLFQAGDF